MIVRIIAATLLILVCSCRGEKRTVRSQAPMSLPQLGVQLPSYPAGAGKEIADRGCLNCHSAELSLQQRISEKQWTAVVDKMIRWGAEVPPEQKPELIAYLGQNFGPRNDSFRPVVTLAVADEHQ